MIETTELPGWCRACGQAPCLCRLCHGAGLLRSGATIGGTVRCSCRPEEVAPPTPASAPPVDLKAERAARRGRTYAERLDL